MAVYESSLDLDLDEGYLNATLSEDGAVRCVFSTMQMLKLGTGSTTRKHISKQYWYIEELGDNMFSARRINSNHVPSGDARKIHLKELMKKYNPEIEFFEEKTIPAMDQLEDHLDDGDMHREDGKLYSAERCYNSALGMDEQNVRALFNLGMVYLDLQDKNKAKDMMDILLNFKATFEAKNQHLFNEFGISLRKADLYDEAVRYYTRALDFTKNDEHLYYNIARANYERSHWPECVEAIANAQKLNPELDACNDLIGIILALGSQPRLCAANNKARVPSYIVDRVHALIKESKRLDPEDILTAEESPLFTGGFNGLEVGHVRSHGSIDTD